MSYQRSDRLMSDLRHAARTTAVYTRPFRQDNPISTDFQTGCFGCSHVKPQMTAEKNYESIWLFGMTILDAEIGPEFIELGAAVVSWADTFMARERTMWHPNEKKYMPQKLWNTLRVRYETLHKVLKGNLNTTAYVRQFKKPGGKVRHVNAMVDMREPLEEFAAKLPDLFGGSTDLLFMHQPRTSTGVYVDLETPRLHKSLEVSDYRFANQTKYNYWVKKNMKPSDSIGLERVSPL